MGHEVGRSTRAGKIPATAAVVERLPFDRHRELHFTTFYDSVLAERQSDLRSYQIVIPIDKIVSASGFDLDAYAEFQAARKPPPPTTPQPTRHEAVLSGDLLIHVERAPRASPTAPDGDGR